ncbi:protoporphyrinogen oxidase [Cerasicoccus arenae]|uniref:Coproporphyrinogen III oxidase n=1 Tax=Cerasicoccus arenae TaxID=424488 RepID=A0A8J3DK96_9BACT|nr:protoporphyrinogen oxidase [Cerasicoccus arenae]MBK1857887.1 protoporphyrinogen oxidase [Cerasicoccus arenae]GHC09469.1 protoporphyrinogen oxidase [Cerasicoccus arenae]
MKSAIVIGGGITGLTLGWALQRAGKSVRVLEKSAQGGGAIRTLRRDGYLAEAGPNSLLVTSPALESFLRGLGLGPQMLKPTESAKKRYILKDDEFVVAPMGGGGIISTPLFSTGAKFRLVGELFAKKPSGLLEESLASFVERHFGPEVLDYAVNPFVGGIYAGDPRKLSAQHAFPMLAEAENDSGSVIIGMIKKRRAKHARGETFKPYSLSFRDGLQALPDAIAAKLGPALNLSAEVLSIEQIDSRWSVTWRNATGVEQTDVTDELYLTIPSFALADLPLPDKVTESLSLLTEIEYPPVASVALGFDRSKVAHPLDGFGGLIPEMEDRAALGMLFSSSLFTGRAPDGKVLLTVFLGGARQPEIAQKAPEEIQEIAVHEVNHLLGATGKPEFAEVTVWPRAIPQYNVGYSDFLDQIAATENAFPGLHLLGNYRGGISVGQCIINAAEAVEPLG